MPRPDEGLIHAWLDGQLPPDEAARIEQLAATDAEWAAAVAEARGLLAASSRILGALDHAPAGVMPKSIVPKGRALRVARPLPWWTKVAAAVVVMAGGSVLVMRNTQAPAAAEKPAVRVAPPAAVNAPVTKATAPVAAAPTPRPIKATRASAEATQAPAPPPPTVHAMVAESKEAVAVKEMMVAAAPAPAPPAPPVGGVAASLAPQARRAGAGACFRLQEREQSSATTVIMRTVRTDGDTLRLEPVQAASPLRAWIVWRDGMGHGAMTQDADGRGVVPVVASPVACPAP